MTKFQLRISTIAKELEAIKKENEELKLSMLRSESTNADMRTSITSKGTKEAFDNWEQNKKSEVERIENFYKEKLRFQEEEHKSILEEVDKLILEQENEMAELKRVNEELTFKLKETMREAEMYKAELVAEREDKQSGQSFTLSVPGSTKSLITVSCL